MGYRGGDLDLRTPQSRSAGERGSFEPPLNGPRDFDDGFASEGRSAIFVDETLLACCNHAYDMALAHRAGEVRIEHLLYALTRIDDAAEVLEKHGVRDASLRREAGAYIASEIPIAPTNGQATPRRSQSLEQALRQAAKQASARNRPASVSDLLTVFTDFMPELPGLQLLHRNVPRLAGDKPGKLHYQPAADAYMPMAQPIDAPRRPMRPLYYDDYAMAEAQNYRHPAMQNHTDMVQNSRLAALEQIVMALREDTGRFADDFAGRFVSLENSFSGGRGDDGQALRQTSERLSGIERSLIGKLEELALQASVLAERLQSMEGRLQSANASGVDLTPINDRLDQLETLILEKTSAPEIDMTPFDGRLNDIETAVLSVPDSRPAVEAVSVRIDKLEQAFSGRFAGLHQAQSADRERVLQETEKLKSSVSAISTSVQERVAAVAQLAQSMDAGRADLAQRLEAVETMTIRHVQEAAEGREASLRQLGEVHEAIGKLNANQHTLAGAIDQWRGESVSDMNIIATRLTQLDIDNDAPLERLELISQRMDGMYRATVERYHRRNRFWYWLFGTDDWIGSSWPSQAAKVEEELRAFSAAKPTA
ncbi:MAG: hypothetical protein APF80_14790 [Alphaproteobacteria bacterium BRH_c36]|nr:MAG: hypothetical protein APF80_14790 [Alphaproteobacteria bacterium BRH_c36]